MCWLMQYRVNIGILLEYELALEEIMWTESKSCKSMEKRGLTMLVVRVVVKTSHTVYNIGQSRHEQ